MNVRRHDATTPPTLAADPSERATSASTTRRALVLRLRDALDAQGVTYCQWKGHWDPARWGRGDGDIDLLVAREHATALAGALATVCFRQAVAPAAEAVPGLVSYFGHDPDVPGFVHVHVHHQLYVAGWSGQWYRLPVEGAVLASRQVGEVFPVPQPEFEFLLFVLRMVLRQGPLGGARLRQEARRAREWDYLARRIDRPLVQALLQAHLPAVPGSLFERCLRSLSPACPVARRAAASLRLRRVLRAYATESCLRALRRRIGTRLRRSLALPGAHTLGPGRQRLLSGGAIVAVLGGDGAGKTTAVDGLVAWFGQTFRTSRVHLGKPPRSWLTLTEATVRHAWRWTRALRRGTHDDPGALLDLRAVCIARDRYHAVRHVVAAAGAGHVVFCDRYPATFLESMDGPQLGRRDPRQASWWRTTLRRVEAGYYRRIVAPDVALLLRVDPAVAAARKVDEDHAYVTARTRAVWNLHGPLPAVVLDAGRPLEEVTRDVRAHLWSRL